MNGDDSNFSGALTFSLLLFFCVKFIQTYSSAKYKKKHKVPLELSSLQFKPAFFLVLPMSVVKSGTGYICLNYW